MAIPGPFSELGLAAPEKPLPQNFAPHAPHHTISRASEIQAWIRYPGRIDPDTKTGIAPLYPGIELSLPRFHCRRIWLEVLNFLVR